MKEKIEPEDKILFMDGTHPHHNPIPACCWILKGETKEIPSNTGIKRINLNGSIDIYNLDVTIREDESINAHSTMELFKEIVKSGDRLNLGTKELIFIEAPMLHWPDSMFCYLTGDNSCNVHENSRPSGGKSGSGRVSLL